MPDSRDPNYGVDHAVSGMNPGLVEALGVELDRIRGLDDPVDVVRHVGQLHATLREHIVDPLSELRLDAIGSLRSQGWSYDRIAARCAMSKERAAQLSREARDRRV